MMLRPVRADELGTFAALPGEPERNAAIREYVARMVASGAMRPEWCFVAEAAGAAVGSVAYWTLPGMDAPLDLVLLEAPWDEPGLDAGALILAHALRGMRRLGAETAGHVLDAPPAAPQWQHHPERRAALLARAGFALRRETIRVEWTGGDPPPEPRRLTFRPLEEVGDAAFVDAIARVSAGTLDREIRGERERQGAAAAARELFDDLRQLGHRPGWWELAFAPGGDLAGLVLPATIPAASTIGYVGVVPEHRGHGYVDDLLARAMATLHAAGPARIVADTDVANAPMAAAFRRAGFRQFATRREYRVDLRQR